MREGLHMGRKLGKGGVEMGGEERGEGSQIGEKKDGEILRNKKKDWKVWIENMKRLCYENRDMMKICIIRNWRIKKRIHERVSEIVTMEKIR